MGFSFGTKKSEIKESTDTYLRTFKKGETKVRFLEEPGDWFAYREHYNPDGGSFPCTQNRATCPGCTHETERVRTAPRRYGTYVFLVDAGRTLPVKMGQKLSDRLALRAEKNGGTLLSRDYTIIRSGADLNTEYDVDQEERYEVDTSALLKQAHEAWGDSIEAIVTQSFIEAWGDPEKFETPAPKASSSTVGDDVPEALKTKAEREYEPSGMDEFAKKDDVMEVSEAGLKKLTRDELIALWNKAELGVIDQDWGKADLIEEILKRVS